MKRLRNFLTVRRSRGRSVLLDSAITQLEDSFGFESEDLEADQLDDDEHELGDFDVGLHTDQDFSELIAVANATMNDTEEATMMVKVLQLNGSTVADVPVGVSQTSAALLRQLRARRRLPVSGHKLVFGNHTFSRHEVLSAHGVTSGSVLYVVNVSSSLEIDLSENRLGAHGLRSFLEDLPEDIPVRSMAFGTCDIQGAEGGQVVAAIVQRTLALSELHLDSNNGFGGACLSAVGLDLNAFAAALPAEGSALSQLSISNLGLVGIPGGRSLASVVRKLPNLKTLVLSSNNGLRAGGIETFFQYLSGNTELEVLQFRDCGLEGSRAGHAVGNVVELSPRLKRLGIGKNSNFGSSGVAALGACISLSTSLEELDLSCCGILGAAGEQALQDVWAKFPNLAYLNLHGNPLDFEIGAEVESCGVQRSISLDNKDSETLAIARRAKLTGKLDLQGDKGMRGSALLELAEALRMNCWNADGLNEMDTYGIKSLSLSHCQLEGEQGGEAIAALVNASETVSRLDLRGNSSLGNLGVRRLFTSLAGGTVLKYISLASCALSGAQGGIAAAGVVGMCPMLQDFSLEQNFLLCADGIQAFAAELPSHQDNSRWRSLNVGVCGLRGAEGVAALRALLVKTPGLQILNLCGNQWAAEGWTPLIDVLSNTIPDLMSLDLSASRLEDDGGGCVVAALLQSLPNLQQLKLGGNSDLHDSGVARIYRDQLPTIALQSLDLSDCGLEGSAGGRAAAGVIGALFCRPPQNCGFEL